MNSYVAHFSVYLFAMIGVICFALFIVKKSITTSYRNRASAFLKVEDTITIAPKKTLYVIRAGEKKLLIASDEGRTTFLTELDENKVKLQKSISEMTSKLAGAKMNNDKQRRLNTPVMRELAAKLK